MNTNIYIAEGVARAYARDQVRAAEARRSARIAREATRERRYVEPQTAPSHAPRRWWFVFTRPTAA